MSNTDLPLSINNHNMHNTGTRLYSANVTKCVRGAGAQCRLDLHFESCGGLKAEGFAPRLCNVIVEIKMQILHDRRSCSSRSQKC